MTDKEKLIKEIESLIGGMGDANDANLFANAQIVKVILQKMMNYANIFNAGAPHWVIPFYANVLGELRGSLIDSMSAEERGVMNSLKEVFGTEKMVVEK